MEEISSTKKVDEKKAAKAAARFEAERKVREEKELKEAALVAEKKKFAAAQNLAAEIYSTGKKGAELLEYIKSTPEKPSGANFVFEILSHLKSPFESATAAVKWCTKSEYGETLSYLLDGKPRDQMAAVYVVQKFCHDLNFPKIDFKDQKKNLIEFFFQIMYQNEIIDQGGFAAWADDDSDDVAPGKQNAVIQTSSFMALINEEDAEEYDD